MATFTSFCRADYENGYSRNLLWRLWQLSHTLATQHLFQMCTEVINIEILKLELTKCVTSGPPWDHV